MDQLLIVGSKSIAQELLVSLQSLGVVQIDPLEPAEGQALARLKLRGEERLTKERWDAVVAQTESLIDMLGLKGRATGTAKSGVPEKLEDIETLLQGVGAQVEGLVAERSEIADELDLIDLYHKVFRELAPGLAQLEGSRYLAGVSFIVSVDAFEATKAALEEALDSQVVLSVKPLESGSRELVVIAAVYKDDIAKLRAALGRLGTAELKLPERYADLGVAKAVHVMEERSQALPKRQKAIEEELAQLAGQHAAKLSALEQVALNQQARFHALEEMAEGRYSFALQGWVPSADSAKVVTALKKQFGERLIIEAVEADPHHAENVPVKLENASWVKPFEGLLALFAPPKYGSFDPSWTLAVFFPLFFGLVVGDIAFGLMFLMLGLWMRARGKNGKPLSLGPLGIVIPPAALVPIGIVVNWTAVWTIVFGFVYGEFFGNFLEKWPKGQPIFSPATESGHGLIPILLFRVEEFTPLLLLTIGFGVLQVLGGWAIRAYYGYIHKDKKHLWEGIGMFSGLLAVVIFAYAFLTNNLNTPVLVISGIGLLIFLVSVVLSGVVLMLVELISNSGNILSYLRLFAVGLSAALIANLVTDLGFALGGIAPVIGPLLGIVIALLVHLIALVLTIIGHTLQPLRLQYVEFFTKFGFYDENGRPYQPFRLFGGKA